MNLREFDRAVGDFDQTIESNPKDALACASRCLAHAGLGDFNRTIADYDRAIGLDPECADTYNFRGLAYYKLTKYDNAIKKFSRATKLDPKLTTARNRWHGFWLLLRRRNIETGTKQSYREKRRSRGKT